MSLNNAIIIIEDAQKKIQFFKVPIGNNIKNLDARIKKLENLKVKQLIKDKDKTAAKKTQNEIDKLEKLRCRKLKEYAEDNKLRDERIDYIRNVPMEDGIERNKMITKEYANLALELNEILGPGAVANWAMFGSIASQNVGEMIRGESANLIEKVSGFFNPVKDMIIRGNGQIFNEIAPALNNFIQFTKNEGSIGSFENNEELFKENMERKGIQSELIAPLFNLYKASKTEDLDKKNELIKLSTIQFLKREQTVAQEEWNTISKNVPWEDTLLTPHVNLNWDGYHANAKKDVPNGNTSFNLAEIKNEELKKEIDYLDKNKEEVKYWTSFDDRMHWLKMTVMKQSDHHGLITSTQRIADMSPCKLDSDVYSPVKP